MAFLTSVIVLSILGAAWSDNRNEAIQEQAAWLVVPKPVDVDVEKFPWQVAVVADDSFFCAGSLVTQKWVMTAAHCTVDYKVFDLAIGSTQEVHQTTQSVTRHPDYAPGSQENDIALLELPTEVPLSNTVGIVRLPTSSFSERNIEGMDVTLSGWDTLQDRLSIWAGVAPPPLKSILVRVAPDSECHTVYGDGFSQNKICLDTTSSPHSEGTLSLVDGGSPIVLLDSDEKYTQVGLLSSGPGNSNLRPPVVATKLLPLLSWIQQVTGMSLE